MFDTYSKIFAERGAAYQQAMAECPGARDAEFQAVLEPLNHKPVRLLCDMPSGGGYLAAHLPAGMRYVGIDPSDDFVSACPVGTVCIKAPITAVPLADGAVDAVVSLAALHHEPDLPAVFGEMRRLLDGDAARYLDCTPPTPRLHARDEAVDQHRGRDDVQLVGREPIFARHTMPPRAAPAADTAAGIVDQDVDSADRLLDLGDDLFEFSLFDQVTRHGGRLAARRANLVRHRVGPGGIAAMDDDLGAFPREKSRGRFTDARTAAGNERGPPR